MESVVRWSHKAQESLDFSLDPFQLCKYYSFKSFLHDKIFYINGKNEKAFQPSLSTFSQRFACMLNSWRNGNRTSWWLAMKCKISRVPKVYGVFVLTLISNETVIGRWENRLSLSASHRPSSISLLTVTPQHVIETSEYVIPTQEYI